VRGRPEALLAIDVGSSSTRVAAVAPSGGVLRGAAAPTPIERPAPGREEVDVERVWATVRKLIGGLELDSLVVRAVGVSALLGTVFFDEDGELLGRALSWSDTRAREWTAGGDAAASVRRFARRRATGELLGPRVAWLGADEPERAARVGRAASIKDAIVARLSGRLVTDPTHASYTGAYDVVARCWSEDLCAAAGLDAALLPPVLAAGEPVGPVEASLAADLGLPAETVVAVGAPDGTAGVLGTGAGQVGQVVDIAGTTDVLMRLVDRPVADDAAITVLNDYPAAGLWALGGPTGMTGGAVAWVARIAGFENLGSALAEVGEEVERIGAGADGVTFRTELTGSRFPRWDARAAGEISGLRPAHGPAHLLRAAREGAAFTVAEGLGTLRDLAGPIDRLTVAGGLARDPAALQMRADICGLPVDGCLDPQVTTLGTAMLAGVAAGVFESLEEAIHHLAPSVAGFDPQPAVTEEYRRLRPRWSR
jgi:sugar (pentulose or hexulose) kinase